jgi:hypothetical protein
MAGYSSRTLADKLGIKAGTRVTALHAPPTYAVLLGTLPEGVTLHSRPFRFINFHPPLCYPPPRAGSRISRIARALTDQGSVWISWPKQSSGVETDLTENVVRELGLAEGLVDVKVCAVDEVWSGLKFVRRVANRRSKPG